MGNIDERRERSANSEIENKAQLAPASAEQKAFPYRKVLMGILIAVIVLVFAVLILNAMIDNVAGKFPEADIDNAVATVKPEDFATKYPEANKFYEDIKKDFWRNYLDEQYVEALENYAASSSSIASKDGVYTYALFAINNLTENDTLGTIILMSFDSTTKKVSYARVESAALVYIPSVESVGPLRDAYKWGSFPLLARTIQENYGVDLNGYVAISYDAVAKAIDNNGALTVKGDASVVEATNAIIAEFKKVEKYKDVANVALEGDSIKLTGVQAVAYLKSFGADKEEALKNVAEAYLPTLLKNGIGGLKGLVDVAGESVVASVAREDLSAIIQMSLNAVGEIGTGITVGDDNGEYLYPNVIGYTDYATERAELLKLFYGIE